MAEDKVKVSEDKRPFSLITGVGEIDDVRMYRGGKVLDLAAKLMGVASRDVSEMFTPELALDVFYAFYLPIPSIDEDRVKLLDANSQRDLVRLATVSQLLSSMGLWRVKPFTSGDNVTSVVAAASFLEKLMRSLGRQMAESRGKSRGEKSREKSREGAGGQRGEMEGSQSQSVDFEQMMRNAVERALEAAERDARTAKSIKQLLSGMGVGSTSTLAFDESADEILRLARETDVQKILENVEGIKLTASKSRKETRYSRGWVRGLEYGSDLERVHYSQLVLPDEYFLASYANSKLLLYEKVLNSTRGPIYVLLDKSGSMVGAKIDWARAVAVALFRKSVEENRRFYARFFDSIAHQPISLKPNTKPRDFLRLLGYLARVKAGGGTDISGALKAAVEDILSTPRGEERVSDIILITDGEDRLNPEQLEATLRRAEARLHSVVIQGHNPYLKRVSHRYMSVKKLESKEALRVVDFT
ncbi:MAG: VWA domain-containing protein [Desulfurococcales archaeon]|nr:VWA domain-containing protein [Desulfurococcales archaeon]